MAKQYFTNPNGELNYGPLTDVSKGWNLLLGDKSGRTVSRRTAHGLKNAFNLENLSDENAEHIVHTGMGLTGSLMFSKNQNLQIAGLLILVGLIFLYWNGKHYTKYQWVQPN